jgi:tetratricopeptide (TPR) repeat protein
MGKILNAALKALIQGAQTSPIIKIPAAFISELASLPDDKQQVLAKLNQDQFNELLNQSYLATINAAASATQAKKNEILLQMVLQKLDELTDKAKIISDFRFQNLPYRSIGTLFKGREDVLNKLKILLRKKTPTAITQTIRGLGGIGKTRLAIEFAWWSLNNKKVNAAFCISASSPELMNASLASLAGPKLLNLPGQKEDEQIASVLRWLNENPGWLMILDNADTEQAANAVEDLLPQLSAGCVIITSRYTRFSASVEVHRLQLLEPDKAVAFLLERTENHRIRKANDTEIANQLAEELGFLPLVLEQAAAYIAHQQITIADYLKQWQSEKQKVLEWFNEHEMNYPASVAITWQRTLKQLSSPANAILRLCSFLSPELIPIAIFEYKKNISLLKKAVILISKELNIPAPQFNINSAVSELAAYSMIDKEEKGFTIHRIVLEVINYRIPENVRLNWLKIALDIVNNFTPTDSDDVRTWPVIDPLFPHIKTIVQKADQKKITEPTSRLMGELDCYLSAKGLYPQAEFFSRRALKIDETSLGLDHPNVARYLNNLAQLLNDTNRLSDAEPLMRRALKIGEASLGLDHPNVARYLNNLASLLQATNRLSEAEPLYERVVKIFEKSFGKDHPNVATALNNLAQLLQDTNRLSEAEPLMRRALKIDETSFGPDHPNLAIYLNNLAQLLQETGRLSEAEPLYKRALKILEASFGPDHPSTKLVRENYELFKLKKAGKS